MPRRPDKSLNPHIGSLLRRWLGCVLVASIALCTASRTVGVERVPLTGHKDLVVCQVIEPSDKRQSDTL
jgi:hypothetical protein